MTPEPGNPTLPLLTETDPTTSGGCGCGGCGCGASANTIEPSENNRTEENPMSEQTTQTFQVTGMTCGHCAGAVTDELTELPGVTDVAVDLVAGGTSTVRVTGDRAVSDDLVAAALEEAGDYRLA